MFNDAACWVVFIPAIFAGAAIRLPDCVLWIFFFGRDSELQIYHVDFILMDNKHRKLFVIKLSRECKVTPKIHPDTFGGSPRLHTRKGDQLLSVKRWSTFKADGREVIGDWKGGRRETPAQSPSEYRIETGCWLRCRDVASRLSASSLGLDGLMDIIATIGFIYHTRTVGWVAEWLACWTQAQKGPGSNRSRDAVG